MTGPRSGDERLLVGTDGRADLTTVVRDVVERSAPVRVAISGPGGSGKSTLLQELESALRAHGVDVVRGVEEAALMNVNGDVALLVDDADRLSDAHLDGLIAMARNGGPHLVAAFRPWPRSRSLMELSDHLSRQRPPVVLRPLSVAGVRARATTLLGDVPDVGQVDRILHLTCGNARLVDLTLTAARDDDWDIGEASAVPASVLDRVRDEFDELDANLVEFLLALAVGFSVAGPVFAMTARFARSDLRALVAEARATGLVTPDASLVPIVRAAILENTLETELWSLQRDLVDAMEAAGLPLGDAALELARLGYRDPRIADALRTRADDVLPTDPTQAWRLYSAAIRSGADGTALGGRRAQAAWAAGDIRAAERLVDGMLTRADPADLPRIMSVAAAVWARKGMLNRSADAYLQLAGTDDGLTAALAAISLAGTGDLERARAMLSEMPDAAYPTSSHVALTLMADGVLSALGGETDRALSSLLQASSVLSESSEILPLPEAPSVLAAQVALNAGELGIAIGVLRSAVEGAEGGPAFRERLRLTEALVALRADRPELARTLLAEVESSPHRLGLRDEVLAHAVRIGLARHTDEIPNLVRAWNAARHSIARTPIDLYGLPALAELTIGAARLHESRLLESHITEAWKLLARAGEPPSWSTSLHWSAIQAAMLQDDTEAFANHESALLDAAAECRVAGHLARAGQVWAGALAGVVDVETVERAARNLAAVGYPWDASRLAGHAAARAREHKDTIHLLALARGLHPEAARRDQTSDHPADTDTAQQHDRLLSAREREVARLVLEGKTYAEIGAAIFISPRTAEHHIARIRRRLGVSTRAELLAELRVALGYGESGQ